jgi:Methyltransferase domain
VEGLDIDPYANDPNRWGVSLITLAEIILACLDAAAPRSIVEVGAYAGDLTELLVDWARGRQARVWAIDPEPQPRLVELAKTRPGLELVQAPSPGALREIPPVEAAILDGDHNYWTVSEELSLIAERAEGGLPLLMFHDVSWPLARRDSYYEPERVPEAHRQPMVEGAGLLPDEPEPRVGGLPYRWAAEREGGPRNGVLTAIEDFAREREGMRLAIVPAFFGLGVLWREDAPWADAVAGILRPVDGDPLLARLEANRVLHVALANLHLTEVHVLRRRLARQEALLQRLLDSSAFGVAERLSRIRLRAGIGAEHDALSKEAIRRVLCTPPDERLS